MSNSGVTQRRKAASEIPNGCKQPGPPSAAKLVSPNDVDTLFSLSATLQDERDGLEKLRKPMPLNVNATESDLFDPFITAAKDNR